MSKTTLDALHLLDAICRDTETLIARRNLKNPYIIGIRSGGVWLADHLAKFLGIDSDVGELDIAFYRDDFSQVGLNPKVGASKLTEATENRDILLVDDVIMTGRTVRAALNELFDFGRPRSVSLIALLDLERRELPIQADVVGGTLSLGPDQQVKLTGPNPLRLNISQRSQNS